MVCWVWRERKMVDEFNYMLFLNAITLGKKKEWCYKENKGVLIALLIPFHIDFYFRLFCWCGLEQFWYGLCYDFGATNTPPVSLKSPLFSTPQEHLNKNSPFPKPHFHFIFIFISTYPFSKINFEIWFPLFHLSLTNKINNSPFVTLFGLKFRLLRISFC